eukprot:9230439-Lingulodinium_polyedra.AAC.1
MWILTPPPPGHLLASNGGRPRGTPLPLGGAVRTPRTPGSRPLARGGICQCDGACEAWTCG